MKIGIIGDIHANLPALEAVIGRLKGNCDAIVCTGDVVGYGPQPNECITLLRKMKIPTVCGNHDEYVVLGTQGVNLNPMARDVIDWTREVIEIEHLKWLADLPMKFSFKKAKHIEIVHASHVTSKKWLYVVDEESALRNFKYQKSEITFYGHTHFPLLFSHLEGMPIRVSRLKDGPLFAGDKFMINVGAVGQPRDNDCKASAVLYNTKTRHLEHLRVPYDLDRVAGLMREYGFHDYLIKRLYEGR